MSPAPRGAKSRPQKKPATGRAAKPILEFRIVEESWSDYELEDGSIIRIKPVLSFLLKEPQRKDDLQMRLGAHVSSWSPAQLRGAKGKKVGVEELEEHVEEDNLKFRPLSEGRGVYEGPDGTITVMLQAHRFRRTSLFDEDGQPQYIVTHSVMISAPDPAKKAESAKR